MPCCSQASNSAAPTGSLGGTFITCTGPSLPLCAPEFSFVSRRLINGRMVWAFHPSAPSSSQRSMSSAGGWKAIQELCEEQPPNTLARERSEERRVGKEGRCGGVPESGKEQA